MWTDNRAHAVVVTLNVDLHDAIKVFRRRALDCSDVRNAGVINQDIHSLAPS